MLSAFLTNLLCSVFLRTYFFATLLSLFKSMGVVSNFPMSNLSTLLFKLFKPFGTFFNLSISNLSTSNFELAQLFFLAKSDVSTPVAFFKADFFAWLDKSNATFTFAPKNVSFGKYSLLYTTSFSPIQLLNELFILSI